MDQTGPLGSLIGFDVEAVSSRSRIGEGRRASDRADAFAEIYDLAAYTNSGSRTFARVGAHEVTAPAPTGSTLSEADRLAADRLYMQLTTGGTWLRVSEEADGRTVMRLHDAEGAPVRELSITEFIDDGPQAA